MESTFRVIALGAALLSLASSPAFAQANPTEADNAIGRNNPCADPWVSFAVSVVKTRDGVVGRAIGSGSSFECDPQLYNGGTWNSYAELTGHVRQTLSTLASQGARFEMIQNRPGIRIANPQPSMLIGQDGAGFVSNNGGSFISNNGGTIVPPGYRLQSADGARVSLQLPGGRSLRVR